MILRLDSISLSNDDQINHSAQLVELDPLKAIEREIIENQTAPMFI